MGHVTHPNESCLLILSRVYVFKRFEPGRVTPQGEGEGRERKREKDGGEDFNVIDDVKGMTPPLPAHRSLTPLPPPPSASGTFFFSFILRSHP